MILAKTELLKAIDCGDIVVRPLVEKHVNANSIDLTLYPQIKVYKEGILDLKAPNDFNTLEIPEEGLVLIPGELYIARTNEYTETHNLVPIMYGKSSLGRLGISPHWTAGLGDVGFKGTWTLEITVVKPVRIYPNMKICQIVYHDVVGSGQYAGKYQGQISATVSRSHKDYE